MRDSGRATVRALVTNCRTMRCDVFACSRVLGGIFRYNGLLQQRAKLEDLEKALKEEQMRMALEKEQHRTTAAECRRLRDEKDW